MIIPVTAVFAAVLGILLLVLSVLAVRFRLKYQIGMGVNDDPVFQATVRAHANLVEYAPLGLIMLAIAELNGVS
ncbi:MAG: MAPEG family protein, partial [Marinobacter sp.]